MSDAQPFNWRGTIRMRVGLAAVALAIWAGAVEAKLVYLQIYRHADLRARAERQQGRTFTVPAKRGEILDREGRVLAYSVDADSIYAVPTEIKDRERTAVSLCAVLEACDASERKLFLERLSRPKAFVFLRRRVSRDEARGIERLNLPGIGLAKEDRRFYPNKELGAHLLGYVGVENAGLAGIEAAYDLQVRGREGAILIQTDAHQHAFSRLGRPATAGAALELTIDTYLQHVAERELAAAVTSNRAAGGSLVIMDPFSGEILALANAPTFNPNAFNAAGDPERRNRAVQDLYEPGSTFKIVTASAAMEEGVMAPEDLIDVSQGMIRFGSRQIDDAHSYGLLSFTDVIVHSSNVGAIKVGLKLGAERLGRYVRRFGFGSRISRDFPGENPGIVWDPTRLDDSALASVSMGYQIGVTPLQMVAAASSIANGGELVEPHVVRALVRNGHRTVIPARVIRRTVGAATAERLTTIMEGVVERGTGRAAQIPGYTVAGKTGTAQKLIGGRYSSSDHYASFVGFVPSRKPVVAIVVMIDAPHGAAGYFGGAVSAPVFKRLADLVLRRLGVARTVNPPPVLVAHADRGVEQEAVVAARTPAVEVMSGRRDVVPDVRGLSGRDAVRTLARVGVSAELHGSGFVVEQDPPAGVPLDRVGSCQLRLERLPIAPAPSPSQQP
ncbi:MAG: transpeptidase family protein [Acidobacteria bacterium]|nr:transpeptidase family protein [Acidobacteriota bacterium]